MHRQVFINLGVSFQVGVTVNNLSPFDMAIPTDSLASIYGLVSLYVDIFIKSGISSKLARSVNRQLVTLIVTDTDITIYFHVLFGMDVIVKGSLSFDVLVAFNGLVSTDK